MKLHKSTQSYSKGKKTIRIKTPQLKKIFTKNNHRATTKHKIPNGINILKQASENMKNHLKSEI